MLAAHVDSLGTPCFRGSLDDVLSRYAAAAEASRADTIVRITCDCPLIDPQIIDAVIAAFREAPEVDYCSNTLMRTYPIGMDTEVLSRGGLERAHAEATQPHEREHVTPFLYQHPELFRLRNVEAPAWARWPELRLTLDEPADLEMLRAVVARAPEQSGLRDVLGVIESEPALAAMNSEVPHRHVERRG